MDASTISAGPPGGGAGAAAGLGRRIAMADIGLVPFLVALPFLYVPKVLEGDTQPWVLIGAIVALFLYRPRLFVQKTDLPAILLAVLALAAYVARSGPTLEAVRSAYIFLTFAVLWILANRGGHDLVRAAVRMVLLVWFLAAFYQYLALQLGLPVSFAGRYVEGRSGIPGLAAEPSYLGSLSIVMMMYLLHDRRKGDWIFFLLAVLNVLMSGSLLAMLLLVFPFLYLRVPAMLAAAAMLFGLVTLDAAFNEGGLSARLAGFQSPSQGLVSLLIDPSLNLRAGHIWFTLWENLPRSLLFAHPIDFQNQYNSFAASTGLLIPTESNFILPMAGELIYSGGIFGLAIVLLLVFRGAWAGPTPWLRFVRGAFVAACLANPVSIANPFLIFFVLQERPWRKR